jgi:class 3 adenylate cyclase/predicted ATPase
LLPLRKQKNRENGLAQEGSRRMKFSEVVGQTLAWLQREGRVSYRALKREFDLDDEYIEDLKVELIETKELAVDKEGKMLVWRGEVPTAPAAHPVVSSPQSAAGPHSQPPVSYTPKHLADRILAERTALETRGGTDGERKTITALFADLKGSTALIEGLDPEDARAIIDPALQLMMDAVHRYEGYVAQALGDGIFALFGAPISHEDHPQRALYAALRMQEEMRRYADRLREQGCPPLLMRVGVNTGEVVVRSIHKEDLHTDYVPVGHSTNLAARMEQLAAPGSILVTEQTHKLTAGYFEFKSMGKTQVKGAEEPLQVYEVLGAGPLRTRLQVAARRGLTRFVGRQREMAQMKLALEQAKAGHGQIVGVMGEPGMGKSRLFYEFKLTSQSGVLVLEAFSVSHGKASAYLPIIELLKAYFEITLEDDERKRREKIGGKVLMLDRSLEDILPYLFALLSIEDPTSPLHQMDAQIRRRRTFEALKRLFLRESLNQPLMLIFEDLHWIDSETQGFLDTLSESVASARLLLLVNYRPEYRHEWSNKTYYTQLRLAPLGQEEAEELLASLLGNDPSLTALKRLVLEKTEGTPFFMEEVIQTLAEEGVLSGERGRYRLVRAPTEIHISPTVQGVLAARIDRLSREEKELLQHLAVIGREFPLSLMRQVISQPEEELYRLLSSLQNKEFLYEQPAFPEVEYLFKHALTQEVAYNSVLHERRKALHEQTATAVETLYGANLEDHYSELAHHYSRSGNTEKAVQYLGLAGQQAVQRSAYTEAVSHLTLALDLLKALPDTRDRAQQELTLRIALGMSLMATTGYTTPEVGQTFIRAHELCQQVGETPQIFSVLRGLWNFYLTRAEYKTARETAEQFLLLAQRLQDPTFLLGAHEQMGFLSFWPAEWMAAREHHEQAVTFYDPQKHSTYVSLYESDLGVWSFAQVALVLWCLGYPEQALQKSREALRLAHKLGHPFSTGWVLICAAWLHQLRQEPQEAKGLAEAAITLSTDQGFLFWLAHGTVQRGWALAQHGQGEEGIAQLRQGMDACRAAGQECARTYFLALLAEAYGHRGQSEAGLSVLSEALEFVEKTGERYCEAELYRLKGELSLQSKQVKTGQDKAEGRSPESEAEECFVKAMTIAKQQQAKSWELRAAMSLSRLWQHQGKGAEAHQMLAEICGWFTEGFDTKDLQEAKALLEELSS